MIIILAMICEKQKITVACQCLFIVLKSDAKSLGFSYPSFASNKDNATLNASQSLIQISQITHAYAYYRQGQKLAGTIQSDYRLTKIGTKPEALGTDYCSISFLWNDETHTTHKPSLMNGAQGSKGAARRAGPRQCRGDETHL